VDGLKGGVGRVGEVGECDTFGVIMADFTFSQSNDCSRI